MVSFISFLELLEQHHHQSEVRSSTLRGHVVVIWNPVKCVLPCLQLALLRCLFFKAAGDEHGSQADWKAEATAREDEEAVLQEAPQRPRQPGACARVQAHGRGLQLGQVSSDFLAWPMAHISNNEFCKRVFSPRLFAINLHLLTTTGPVWVPCSYFSQTAAHAYSQEVLRWRQTGRNDDWGWRGACDAEDGLHDRCESSPAQQFVFGVPCAVIRFIVIRIIRSQLLRANCYDPWNVDRWYVLFFMMQDKRFESLKHEFGILFL